MNMEPKLQYSKILTEAFTKPDPYRYLASATYKTENPTKQQRDKCKGVWYTWRYSADVVMILYKK